MTETERLLVEATEIAKRHFIDPSEQAVMQLFNRVCDEQDRSAYMNAGGESATIH